MITPAARRDAVEGGFCHQTLLGVKPQIVDGNGVVLEGSCSGNLVIEEILAGPDAHRLRRS